MAAVVCRNAVFVAITFVGRRNYRAGNNRSRSVVDKARDLAGVKLCEAGSRKQ